MKFLALLREKLLDLAVDGMITNSEFRDRNDALTAREGDLEAELKKIKENFQKK